jgi:hypothetical protein
MNGNVESASGLRAMRNSADIDGAR